MGLPYEAEARNLLYFLAARVSGPRSPSVQIPLRLTWAEVGAGVHSGSLEAVICSFERQVPWDGAVDRHSRDPSVQW